MSEIASHSSPRHLPGEVRIAFAQKLFVFDAAEPLAGAGEFRIVVIDDQRLRLGSRQRLLHHLGKFAVDDQHLGLGMVEREGE